MITAVRISNVYPDLINCYIIAYITRNIYIITNNLGIGVSRHVFYFWIIIV